MEGNIYNNMSKEINFKLPDISFDSDSDDVDDGQIVKPYIRPSADILFGTDDSDSEDILRILAKMPQASDLVARAPVSNDQDSQISPNDVEISLGHERLPFNNIHLPNGIASQSLLSNRPHDDLSDKILLTKFGVRDNIDLDQVLDEIDLSSYKSTFFEDVLSNYGEVPSAEVPDETTSSDLLKRLDDISKKYEVSSRNNNNSNALLYSHSGTSPLSLANLFDQMKEERAMNMTFVDLRMENRLFVQPVQKLLEKEESSDDEDSSNDDDHWSGGLWIDNFRRAKSAQTRSNQPNGHNTDLINRPLEIPYKVTGDDMILTSVIVKTNTINGLEDDQEEDIPKHVQIKIEKIKNREKLLSERRYLINQLRELTASSESYPALLHEEISFDTVENRLVTELNPSSDWKHFNAFITISPPNSIMTISKVPSHFSVDHAKENFIFFLSLMLQSTEGQLGGNLPFTVIALQQIHYQNQLQLALLCRTDSPSFSKLRSDLRSITLGDLVPPQDELHHVLSNLPLSNILRIQPYDPILNGNIWNWDNASIVWHKGSVDNVVHHSTSTISQSFGKETSCVILEKDFYLTSDFRKLLSTLLDRFTVAGIRYLHTREKNNRLVLALRGFGVINVVKGLQNLSPYEDNIICTKFEEDSAKDMCKYFGPRLNEERIKLFIEKGHCSIIVNELSFGMGLYNSLYWVPPNDVMLLVSPMCLDVGWIVNILQETCGYLLINIVRLNVTVSVGRQFGISEKALDFYESGNGVSHLLIVRNENPLHSLKFGLDQCLRFMTDQDSVTLDHDRFFHASLYADSLMDILDIHKSIQTPEIRELNCDVAEVPFEDCEQCTFVLIITDELTRHVAQILDQMTNLDLLAIKCLSDDIDEDHFDLLKSQFQLRLPNFKECPSNDSAEPRMQICLIAVRSMYIIQELEKIHDNIKLEKNLVFAYTMTTETTFRMIGSFFTSPELVSDPRRRSSLRFLPSSITSDFHKTSLLAQLALCHSSIETVMVVYITSRELVLPQFRKIWLLLTRDGFTITNMILGQDMKLHIVVQRPNAIFYLVQWINSHFSDDENIEFVTEPGDVSHFLNRLPSNVDQPSKISLNHSANKAEFTFVMVKHSLLETTVEMLSNIKQFWSFLEANKYYCIGLSLVNVDGSTMFKLRDISLLNLSGNQLQKETRYLSLLLVRDLSSSSSRDQINWKLETLKLNSQLKEDIYLNNESEQIDQCCSILLREAVATDNECQ